MREAERKEKESERKEKKRKEKSGEEKKRGEKKSVSFYAKESDMRHAFYSNQPMIVLLYKEAYFNSNDVNSIVPSVASSLLQEYADVFPKEMPSGLPTIRGSNIRLTLYLELLFQTNQPIEATLRRQRSFKGKLRSC